MENRIADLIYFFVGGAVQHFEKLIKWSRKKVLLCFQWLFASFKLKAIKTHINHNSNEKQYSPQSDFHEDYRRSTQRLSK